MAILESPTLIKRYADYAFDLLRTFARNCRLIFGETFLVYNLHAILHLSEDAKRFGPLTGVSSFPFESFNASFRKFIRARKHPVQEYMNRFYEKCNVSFFCDPVECNSVQTFIVGKYLVVPNNFTDVKNHELQSVECKIYNNTNPLFLQPFDSFMISVFKCCFNQFIVRPVEKHLLTVKCIVFSKFDEHVVVPLWHTL